MSSSSDLFLNAFNREDLALCEGNYINGVTPITPADGCVTVSIENLYADKTANLLAMPTKTICIGANGPNGGHLKVNYKMMKELGLIDDDKTSERYGLSKLSGISPGPKISVTLFSHPDYQGQNMTVTVADQGALSGRVYHNGDIVNDNVLSFTIEANTKYFYAGEDCSATVGVCIGEKKRKDIIEYTPEDGCFIASNDDPTEKGREESYARIVRFCTTKRAGDIQVSGDDLRSALLAHKHGDRNPEISFLKKGRVVNLKYFSSKFQGQTAQYTGALSAFHYDNGQKVNDAVRSLIFSSKIWTKVPPSCKV